MLFFFFYFFESDLVLNSGLLRKILTYVTLKNFMISFASQGVFLVKTKNAFVPVERDDSVDTYSRISIVPGRSERSK